MREGAPGNSSASARRGYALTFAYLSPHVVLATCIVLLHTSPTTLPRSALWFWLAALILDEAAFRLWPQWAARGVAVHAGLARALDHAILPLLLVLVVSAVGVTAQAGLVPLLSIAIVCGFAGAIFAIPAAHDLMHGRTRLDRVSAAAIMALFSYPHFCIEHVYGHHRNVGANDPATARLGESVYAFYQRSIFDGAIDAWRIETTRLARRGLRVFVAQNRILQYLVLVGAFYALAAAFAGWRGVLFLAMQGIIGAYTLETINYVQHYGLSRRRLANGAYEPVREIHSWNSNHPLSNWFMFNLARHSDHHLDAGKASMALTSRAGAPQLPVGYFLLLYLALIPPLWRRIMDHRVGAWRERHWSGTAEGAHDENLRILQTR